MRSMNQPGAEGLETTNLYYPSLTLSHGLPQFRSWADLDGGPMKLPSKESGRATMLINRDGEPASPLLHDPALRDEPKLLDAI